MPVTLKITEEPDLACLMDYVRAFHATETFALDDEMRKAALRPLLGINPLGRIWLIHADEAPVGYLALCFGYAIEFAGRDAFVDELFIAPEQRGRGYGKAALRLMLAEAARLGVRAVHLEVARDNPRALGLYRAAGFAAREKYTLMSARTDTA
jgi:ribosomal protein S18 acetylase RimI-like enzyme